LIGLLIDKSIIADDPTSFALTLDTDWPTREFAISRSKQFSSFMTATEVPTGDVAQLMASSLVPDSVKVTVLDRVDEFVSTNNRRALTAIAEYANSKQKELTIELVTRMAVAGVESQLLLRVLEPLLAKLTEAQLVEVLQILGGGYTAASERNGKHPKLPNSAPNRALVERLRDFDLVSSYRISGGEITVHMRKS
jgi:hypothetical protein